MTDIQNPGAVKPEALTDEQILELAKRHSSGTNSVYILLTEEVIAVVRAALELQPEPALTDTQICWIAHDILPRELRYSPECDVDDLIKFARAVLGRGVPSSLLEKSEGSFHPVSALLEEKKP